jgi:Ala-tRNA(Pro) deacylase
MSNRFRFDYNSQIPVRLISFLNASAVRYEILHQPFDLAPRAQQPPLVPVSIQSTVVRTGKQHLLAVFPAGHSVDLKKLARLISEPVRLETEDDFKWLFPDCALGAIPPFGNLYGLTTWIDSSLARTDHIVFFAGNLNDSIKLAYSEYVAIVEPRIGEFTGRGLRSGHAL